MNIKIRIVWVGLVGSFCFVQAEFKKQNAVVRNIVSSVNDTYAIVRTTITKTTSPAAQKNAGEVESKLIITREQVGTIDSKSDNFGPVDITLSFSVPDATQRAYDLQLQNTLQALVGSGSGGIVADYAQEVVERQLNEFYGAQPYTFTLLEIMPTRYYRINSTTQKVEVTDAFSKDFPQYQKQSQRYMIALGLFSGSRMAYNKWVPSYTAAYPVLARNNPAEATRYAQIVKDYYTNTLVPALEVKEREERAFAALYAPYRIALMANPTPRGNTCGSSGSGPWEFSIVYYVGALQTGATAMKFCVPSPNDEQRLDVSFVSDFIKQPIKYRSAEPLQKERHQLIMELIRQLNLKGFNAVLDVNGIQVVDRKSQLLSRTQLKEVISQIDVKFLAVLDAYRDDSKVEENSHGIVLSVQENQKLVLGGIKIAQPLNDLSERPNINFLKQDNRGLYGEKETAVCNWSSGMVAYVEDYDISQFLIPFDIYKLQKIYIADQNAQQDAKWKALSSSLDEVIRLAEKTKAAVNVEQQKQQVLRRNFVENDKPGSGSFVGLFDSSFGKGEVPASSMSAQP